MEEEAGRGKKLVSAKKETNIWTDFFYPPSTPVTGIKILNIDAKRFSPSRRCPGEKQSRKISKRREAVALITGYTLMYWGNFIEADG
ncbi:hypothetical protein Trydic_g10844 [Trypoxylus dichotomus]